METLEKFMGEGNNNLEKIVKKIHSINSFYRRGKFEISVTENENSEYIESEDSKAIELRQAADKLFWEVERLWNSKEKPQIPSESFAELMRGMTISFEIDEYFIDISEPKKSFFEDIRKKFFNFEGEELTINLVKAKIDSFRNKIINHQEKVDFVKFSYELILFCMCGINVLLLKQNATNYETALENIYTLDQVIEIVLEIEKIESPFPQKKALGLRGLNHYFEGRCYFSLGQFRNAELAFKKSVSLYLEKMNLLVASASKEDAETRTLALRRAGLAEIIGLANLYLIESRIDEAIEIVERVSPLLKFATGKRMIAYCDLVKASVNRAKHSSKPNKLEKIEEEISTCLGAIKDFKGKPHSYYKGIIELCLVKFYKVSKENIEEKKRCYENCIKDLTETHKFAEKHAEKFINRRIAIESVTLRSHIYRNLANIDFKYFSFYMKKAYDDANTAIEYSQSLSQLESDSYIALGLVYRSLFLNDKIILEKDGIKELADYKERARDSFFRALDLNIDNNNRLSAICYLRLAELETLNNQTNFVKAKLFFEKYKAIENEVGHTYILEFGESLKKQLEDNRFIFFLDPKESLELSYWEKKVKEFLINQTVYFAALKYKDNLPENRRRGERAKSEKNIITNNLQKQKQKNATRQSILADFFRDEMGITSNERYVLASQNLSEFERYCEELNK